MSTLIQCGTCNGRKILRGLGNIEKKCEQCNGVGWVTKEDPIIEEPVKKPRKKKD